MAPRLLQFSEVRSPRASRFFIFSVLERKAVGFLTAVDKIIVIYFDMQIAATPAPTMRTAKASTVAHKNFIRRDGTEINLGYLRVC